MSQSRISEARFILFNHEKRLVTQLLPYLMCKSRPDSAEENRPLDKPTKLMIGRKCGIRCLSRHLFTSSGTTFRPNANNLRSLNFDQLSCQRSENRLSSWPNLFFRRSFCASLLNHKTQREFKVEQLPSEIIGLVSFCVSCCSVRSSLETSNPSMSLTVRLFE